MRDRTRAGADAGFSAPRGPREIEDFVEWDGARPSRREMQGPSGSRPPNGKLEWMAAEVLCGRCGALLTHPTAPCPRCGSPASGRYAAAVARPRKSPRLAAVLAIVPGLGHFYLGHNLKGFGFLLGIGGFQLF